MLPAFDLSDSIHQRQQACATTWGKSTTSPTDQSARLTPVIPMPSFPMQIECARSLITAFLFTGLRRLKTLISLLDISVHPLPIGPLFSQFHTNRYRDIL